jgi:hypothetical protein
VKRINDEGAQSPDSSAPILLSICLGLLVMVVEVETSAGQSIHRELGRINEAGDPLGRGEGEGNTGETEEEESTKERHLSLCGFPGACAMASNGLRPPPALRLRRSDLRMPRSGGRSGVAFILRSSATKNGFLLSCENPGLEQELTERTEAGMVQPNEKNRANGAASLQGKWPGSGLAALCASRFPAPGSLP